MVTPIQPSFARGEITPLAHGRVDIAAYTVGLARCENWVVTPFGSLTRRPGTRFVTSTKADGQARLIPFTFSTEQAYILEFGDQYMRVYRERGVVLSGGAPYEITTPYSAAEAFELHFTQSADVLYLAHKDHPPHKLSRAGDADWTLTQIAFTAQPAAWAAGNYPQRVGFFEDRLVWAAPPQQPQTLYFSKTGDFENLTTGSVDDDGLELTISAGQVNAIQWLAEDQALLIGTSGATRTLSGAGIDEPLTPNSIKQKRQSSDGSVAVQPIQTGETTLFIGGFGRKLREMAFSLDANRFVSPDQSILAEHLLGSGVAAVAYQKAPYSIVWCAVGDGRLAAFTYLPAQQVFAWHRHTIAGGRADDWGAVESVAVIPGQDSDELWLIVKRTVNGQTVRHVEYMDRFFRAADPTDKDAAHYVDAGLLYEAGPGGAAAATFTGLEHLEGEDVQILADGAVSPQRRVLQGRITLANGAAADCAHVGLGYRSVAQTLRPNGGAPDGSAMGRQKRIRKTTVDVFDTLNLRIGPAIDRAEFIVGRRPNDPMDASPPLRTEEVEVTFDGAWERPGQIFMVHNDPLPATIRAIVPHIEVER